jgi:hypothetical protein
MSEPFATLTDVMTISGATYTAEQQTRITALLPLISDLIRSEGVSVGKDIDEAVSTDDAYASVVKMVTCDVVARIMRQSTSGEPVSQESQSALGYSWSGTYAVPGGGAAMSLMNNERKMLGLKRQKYGAMEIWDRLDQEA